jgi:hypothetical protein
MLFQPQKPRHPLFGFLRRLITWRPEPRRTDIRDLGRYLREDIGVPDYPIDPRPGAEGWK